MSSNIAALWVLIPPACASDRVTSAANQEDVIRIASSALHRRPAAPGQLIDGFQTARLVHFRGMAVNVGFQVVHLAPSLPVPRTLWAMLSGGRRDRIET